MWKQWKPWQTLFSWAPKSMQMVTATMKLKDSCSLGVGRGGGNYDQLDNILKSRHYFANKGLSSQSYGFSIAGPYRKLSTKELMLLNCGVGEDSWDYKEINPVNLKGNQSWIFIGRTDAEAPVFWQSDMKNWLIGKDPDAGKDWRQEEKGMPEDEMVGWHLWLNGHVFEQAPGDGECCRPWGR